MSHKALVAGAVVIIVLALAVIFVPSGRTNNDFDHMNTEQRATELANKKVFEEMGVAEDNVAEVQAVEKGPNDWEVIYDLKTTDPYSRIKVRVDLSTGAVTTEKVEK